MHFLILHGISTCGRVGRSDRVGAYGLPPREDHRRRSVVETLRLAVCVLGNLLFYDLNVLGSIEYGEPPGKACAPRCLIPY